MKYEKDIFISYAHLDNRPVMGVRWIDLFHTELETRLSQVLGADAKVFRDPQLKGSEIFADRLLEELRKAALMVSVMSPRYLNSVWCTREVDSFIEAFEEGAPGGEPHLVKIAKPTVPLLDALAKSGDFKIGSRPRVLKVVKTPVERQKSDPAEDGKEKAAVPTLLNDVLGFEFFNRDPQTKEVWELDPSQPEDKREYLKLINKLAYEIKELLDLVKGARPAGADKPVVYLALTSFDLKKERENLEIDLRRSGYTVLPESEPPETQQDTEQFAAAELSRASLSIHLIGRHYGKTPEDSDLSLVELQHQQAVLRAGDGFRRVVWMPPGLAPEEPRQQEVVERIRKAPFSGRVADLVDGEMEELKTLVHDRLDELEQAAAAERGSVFLAETSSDREDLRAMLRRKVEEAGFTVVALGDPPLLAGEVETATRARLADCRASIHVIGAAYGVVPEGTDRSIVELQLELAGEREKEGGLTRLVWHAPGLSSDDARQQGLLAKVGAAADRMEVPEDRLGETLLERLRPPKDEQAPPAAAGKTASGAPRVFILCEEKDDVGPLREQIKLAGYPAVTPSFEYKEDDPEEFRADIAAKYNRSDVLLVYFDAGKPSWLRSHTDELAKLPEDSRKKPLRARVLWLGPSKVGDADNWRDELSGWIVIEQPPTLDVAALQPLTSKVGPGVDDAGSR